MKTAMILAAGRGERLKPLTELQPKALCLVKGKPLIEHHVLNLAKAGFNKIIINHAYLGSQIRQHLGDGSHYGVKIHYSPEPPGALETGGGIINALPLLGDESFITVNADIYTDFDFATIQPVHEDTIHVVLAPKNPQLNHHGDFGLIKGNQLINTNPEYILAGICCYHPQLFSKHLLRRFSVASIIRHCADQQKATATLYEGVWFDIGTLERLQMANA